MSRDWASSSLPVEILLGRLSTIALQIQQCRELGELIQNAIEAARDLLQTDRVIIYRFLPNRDGVVAFESIGAEAHPILGQLIYDPCLDAQWVERYQQGQTTAIADIHTAHIPACYVEFLDRIQVRANLVVPILSQGNLWGLLIAHHCHRPRNWQPLDVQVLQHIAIHLGIAIQQAALHQHDPQQYNPDSSHPNQPDTKLDKSKILLAEAQRVARIGNWEYDLTTRKNTWTEELFYLFNRDPSSGEPPYEEQYRLCHPDDWAPLHAAMANALALGKPYHLVFRVPQADDSIRYLEAIGQADQDEQGQVIRLYGTVQDITERKRIELALQHSEEQRRFILDATQVGLWDWNMLTGELIWTENTFRLLGYAPEEVTPTQAAWRDRVHPDDVASLDQALQRDIESQTGGEVEYRVVFPDGSVHWLLGKGRVIFNELGKPIRMVGSLLDISDRKATELALQQSESRFRRIVDSNIVGVILCSPTGEILETNDAFLQMLGYTQAEWLAGHLRWDTITPADYHAVDAAAVEHLLTQGWMRPFEKEYIRKDGSRVAVMVGGALVDDDRDWITAVILDISDRKRNEAEQQQRAALIQNIAQGVSAATGAAFFQSLVRYLIRSLDVSQAFVGELVAPDKTQIKIIAGVNTDQVLDGLEYPIAGTPCEQVVKQGFCLYPERVQQIFPTDEALQATGGQSYVGIPLVSSTGEVMGLIGIINHQPLADAQWVEEVLTIFAIRAASELERQQSEVLLRRYERIISATPDCISLLDRNYVYQVINQTYLKWNQKSYEEIIGHSVSDLLGQDFFETASKPLLDRCLSEGTSQVVESWLNYGDGQRRFVRATYAPYIDPDGSISGVVINVHNLTDLKLAEEALTDSEERFRQMAERIHEVFWMSDVEFTQMLYVSPAYEEIWGRSCESLYEQPRSFLDVVHPDDYEQVIETIYQQRLDGFSHEYRLLHPDGSIRWIWERAFLVLDADGKPYRLVGVSQDISDRKQTEAQLIHSAFHDALTDLPNRDLFMQRLELALHHAQRSEAYHFAVLFMDLDQFKVINDSLGHLVGDQLLISIARKLQSMIRTTDLVARLGGDEFVVLLEDIEGLEEAIRVSERVCTELQSSLVLEGRTVFTSASIGIVLGNHTYHHASDVLRDADIAMYRAKLQGRARYEVFDAEMHTQAFQRMHLENELRRAIEQQEFVIYYQPIVALDTRHLVGFEALVRWQHPTRGLIAPGGFIAIAEDTGLIVALDRWLLGAVSQQLAVWHQQFPQSSSIKVSVNLSGRTLREPHLVETIGQILQATNLPRNCLTLEITESMLIENIEAAIEVLSQLRQQGVQISIDDFGTGYSSLSYLYRLPVDTLKIDQSFVSQMQISSGRNHKIVQTIITLSNQLELEAIAEGIETQQQLQWLQELGCELGQGYLFAKPLPAQTATAFLTQLT